MNQGIQPLHDIEQMLLKIQKAYSYFSESKQHNFFDKSPRILSYNKTIALTETENSGISKLIDYVQKSQLILNQMNEGNYEIHSNGWFPEIASIVNFYNETHKEMKKIISANKNKKGSNENFNNDNYWKKCLEIFKSLSEKNEEIIRLSDPKKSSSNISVFNSNTYGISYSTEKVTSHGLSENQMKALQEMQQNLIIGNMEEFHQQYNKPYMKKEEKKEYFLKEHNLDIGLLEKIIPEFESFCKIKKEMEGLLNSFGGQTYTFNKTISESCLYLINEIKNKVEVNKNEKTMIKKAQKQILMGERLSYYEENMIKDVLGPIIEDYKTIEKIRDKLYVMWDGEENLNTRVKTDIHENMSNEALNLLNTIFETLKETKNEVKINSNEKGIINWIKDMIENYKIMEKINENKQIGSNSQNSSSYINYKNQIYQLVKLEFQLLSHPIEEEIKNTIEDEIHNFICQKNFSFKTLMNKSENNEKVFEERIILMILDELEKDLEIEKGTIFEKGFKDIKKQIGQLYDELVKKDTNKIEVNRDDSFYEVLSIESTKLTSEEAQRSGLTKSKEYIVNNEGINLKVATESEIAEFENVVEETKRIICKVKEIFNKTKEDLQNLEIKNDELTKTLEGNRNIQAEQINKAIYNYEEQINTIRWVELEKQKELEEKVNKLEEEIEKAKIGYEKEKAIFLEEAAKKQEVYGKTEEDTHSKNNITILEESIEDFIDKFKTISKEPTAKSLEDVGNKIKEFYDNHEKEYKENEEYIRKVMIELQRANIGVVKKEINEQDIPKISVDQMKKEIKSELEKLSTGKIRITNQTKLNSTEHYIRKIEGFVEDYLGKAEVVKYVQLYSSVTGGDINSAIMRKPNTLTIIKTKFGNHFGCFSSLSHCGKFDGSTTKGLLFSDYQSKAFPLKAGEKPLKVNEGKIIFGNEEIVLNKNEKEKECEVMMKGVKAAFDVGLIKNEQFTNIPKSNIEISGFEVYEVILKNFKQVNVEAIEQMNEERNKIDSKNGSSQRLSRMNQSNERGRDSSSSRSKDQSVAKSSYSREDVERYKKTINTLKFENDELKKALNKLEEENKQVNIKLRKSINLGNIEENEEEEEEEDNSPQRNSTSNAENKDSSADNNELMISLEQRLQEKTESEKELKRELEYKNNLIKEASNKSALELSKLKEEKENLLKRLEENQSHQVASHQVQSINKEENQNRNEEIHKLMEQISNLKKEIERLTVENKILKDKISSMEKITKSVEQFEEMQSQIMELRKQIQEENNTLQNIKKEHQEYQIRETSTKEAKEEIEKLEQQLNSLKGVIKLYENKKEAAERNYKTVQVKEDKLKELEDQVSNLEEQKKTLERENEEGQKLIQDISTCEEKKTKLSHEIKQLKETQEELQNQIIKSSGEISNLQTKQYNLNKDIETARKLLQTENDKMEGLRFEHKTKENEINEWQQKCDTLRATQRDLEYLKKELETEQDKKQLLDKEIENKKNKLKEVERALISTQSSVRLNGLESKFFAGSVIDHDEDKHFIVKELYNHYPYKRILKTKLLFAYPLMHGLDPHNFVDNNSHYILIIKMVDKDPKTGKNYIIACYSENPLIQKGPRNDGVGFISSVTNGKTFYLKKGIKDNPRLTEYDQFYFKYGNSEIVFKINQTKIEFNIGHNFKSLETGNIKDPSIFIGSELESGIMESYEAYKIIFDE